jgi:hypothetical protein
LLRASDPGPNHLEPPTDTSVTSHYAYFAATLEQTLKDELSEEIFASSLETACNEFGAHVGRDAQKSPEVMKKLLLDAAAKGPTSKTLQEIIRTTWRNLKGAELP